MKASPSQTNQSYRSPKDATLRVRCSGTLKTRLSRIAAMKEADLSDVMREAFQLYALKHEQHFS